MGWSIGFDPNWKRDVGYGVPALCDHPGCDKEIDRGLGYVCGGEPYGGEHGCGLHFCGSHLQHRYPRGEDRGYQNCKRCMTYRLPYKPKPDTDEWNAHKLADASWARWRSENPDEVAAIKASMTIKVGGEVYRKFIPYPGPVDDGTLRCISCGQIDEDDLHDAALCRACDEAPIISSGTSAIRQRGESE